ncbi:MAG: DUF4911 domain-containing protein [Synergistaceae bacterium]|nr:DUF4911 domain-containing protein [Synergistaceae bacterium]
MIESICEISLTVPQKDIYYISWNIDACEGLGFLQTDEPSAGKVTVFTPLCLIDDMYSFIDGLRAEGVNVEITGVKGLKEKTDD